MTKPNISVFLRKFPRDLKILQLKIKTENARTCILCFSVLNIKWVYSSTFTTLLIFSTSPSLLKMVTR